MVTTQRRLLSVVAVAALVLAVPVRAKDIAFRSFSDAAAIGPPALAFAEELERLSRLTLGEAGAVRFTRLAGTPAIPARFGGDIMKAVAAGSAGGGFDAAYQSGGEINATWGFIYNSGVPFGPTFDEFMGFLYGRSEAQGGTTGLELLQATLDAAGANVVAVPIVGSTEQASGYFPAPIGDVRGRRGIGLAGLCRSGWTFRYLPPAQYVLQQACADLVARRAIKASNVKFIAAIPGGGSLVAAVKAGTIQAFEFATPLDDQSQLFAGSENPGTVGVRYLHLPGWHQQFLLTYLLVNRQVWDGLTPAQQALIQTAGRAHVLASYGENLRRQGPALKAILEANRATASADDDLVLVQWPDRDLALLRDATLEMLDARAEDPALPPADRQAYGVILERLRSFVRANASYWEHRAVDPRMRFHRPCGAKGQPWTEAEQADCPKG